MFYCLEEELHTMNQRYKKGKFEYVIGSCKYRNEKIGVDELELLRHYAAAFEKGSSQRSAQSECPMDIRFTPTEAG